MAAAGRLCAFAADLATAFAGAFFSAFRAEAAGAGFARAATDGFDFAAIFLGLATALAMRDGSGFLGFRFCAPYTILGGSAQLRNGGFQALTDAAIGAGQGRSDRRGSDRSL